MQFAPSGSPGEAPRPEPPRVSGLAVLLAIVVVGLLTGAGFYRWKRGQMDARVREQLAAAPETPEERLALWLQQGGAQLHHRLAVVGRFAPDMPWLVTHARPVEGAGAGDEVEVFGVECATLPKDLAHIEGMTVVVELPAPRALGHARLVGERAGRVPVFAAGEDPRAAERLSSLALYLLEGLPRALERDIPGARIEIRVADADGPRGGG